METSCINKQKKEGTPGIWEVGHHGSSCHLCLSVVRTKWTPLAGDQCDNVKKVGQGPTCPAKNNSNVYITTVSI